VDESQEDYVENPPQGDIPKSITLEGGRITAYQCTGMPMVIRRASKYREWMERSTNKFAYRCLPLVIANQKGWDFINPVTFHATWNGKTNKEAVKLEFEPNTYQEHVKSHFGEGTLTFLLGYVIRTPPGWNVWVQGPPNWPKDGVQALQGEVETDWPPMTFTMNWIMTRPGHRVTFEAGEPICRIIPVPRFSSEVLTPVIENIESNPGLEEQFKEWSKKRNAFNLDLKRPDSEAVKQKWQKDYFQGEVDGISQEDHQTKLQHPEFLDLRNPEYRKRDHLPLKSHRTVTLNTLGIKIPVKVVTPPWKPDDVVQKRDTDSST
jgi:hypothetical protein